MSHQPISIEYVCSPSRTKSYDWRTVLASIHGHDPVEMSKRLLALPYAEFLATPYWIAVANAAKERAGWKCQLCNATDDITTHHRTYENHGEEHLHPNDLTALCWRCHNAHHARILLTKAERRRRNSIIVLAKFSGTPIRVLNSIPNRKLGAILRLFFNGDRGHAKKLLAEEQYRFESH